MGNSNGREEGNENGGDGGDEASGDPNHAPSARVASADIMVSSPPHDHGQSRSPLLFSSQVRLSFVLGMCIYLDAYMCGL